MAANDRFEIPPEMRAFAEKSVDQARQAFDGFIAAAHNAVSAFEGQAETARKGAKDVAGKAINFAEQNIASSFELAQQLLRLHQAPDAGAGRPGQGAGRKRDHGGQGRCIP
jgi:hypothetical protein